MIRRATIEDLATIVDMAWAMHIEAPNYKGVPFVPADMGAFIEQCLGDDDKCIFLATRDDGEIMGMIGGMMVPFMFNFRHKYAADFGFYVLPAARGGTAAARLLRAYEGWALSNHAVRICIGESTGTVPEKFHEFLVKLGYNKSATIYAKEV